MGCDWDQDALLTDFFDTFRGFKAMMDEEASRFELKPTHIGTLRVLRHRGGCTMSELTEMLDVTHGASTGIIDRLAKMGLVVRQHSPQDRRVVHVTLSPEGEALFSQIRCNVQARFEAMFGRLNAADQAAITQGVNLLAQCFRSAPSTDGDEIHAASR